MRRRIGVLAGAIAILAASVLAAAAPAGAAEYQLHGACCSNGSSTMTGSLHGTWGWTSPEEGWASFFATLQYDPATGIMTFRIPEMFVGRFKGREGSFRSEGVSFQRFKPGTELYDFTRWPEDQPGTTGDPKQWLGGWGVSRIVEGSGTGGLQGVSGYLAFTNRVLLGTTTYTGVIDL
jgi:hypothetical protein